MGKYDALFQDEAPKGRGKYSALFEDEGYKPPLTPEQQQQNIEKGRQEAIRALPLGERLTAGVGKGLMDTFAGIGQLATKATDFAGITEGVNKRISDWYQGERDVYNQATKGDIASRVGEVAGNVAIGAAIPMGGAAGLTAKAGQTIGGRLGGALASRVGSTAIGQAAEGAVLGAAQFAGEGESRAGNAALGGALGGAIPVASKGAVAAGKGFNKLLGKAAEELSGVSEEALRMYGTGTGAGAKALKSASGTQNEIGQRLVKMLDNLDDYLPEKEVVDKALQQMPDVNVANTIKTLEQAKTGGVLKSSRETNDKITGLIKDLTDAADETGSIPAAKFREIRRELDELAGDAFGKESNKFVTAVKMARHSMADDLVTTAEASGNTEYTQAMKDMARKLRVADDLKQFLGKSAQTREARAESFVSTLFGKNKEERQKAVQAMGDVFGQDFIQESKLANLAAELGEDGTPSLLPRQFTGRSALGPALSGGLVLSGGGIPSAIIPTALSSPRVASMALGATDITGATARKVGQRLGSIQPLASRTLVSTGTQQNQRRR